MGNRQPSLFTLTTPSSSKLPVWILTVIVLSAMGIFVGVSAVMWNEHQTLEDFERRVSKTLDVHASVKYLDEVLTSAARLSLDCTTGEWPARYRRHKSQLEECFQQLRRLADSEKSLAEIERLERANQKLFDIEEQVFTYLEFKQRAQAAALLESDEYAAAKRELAAAIRTHRRLIDISLRKQEQLESAYVRGVVISLVVGSLMMLVVWILMHRVLRRHLSERDKYEGDLRSLLYILDGADEAIYVVDKVSGYMTYANQQAREQLGYTHEEVFQLRVFDIAEGLREHFDNDWGTYTAGLLAIPEPWVLQGRHVRKDGSSLPVEVSIRLEELDGREFFVCFARDLTERRKIDRALSKRIEFEGLVTDIAMRFINLDVEKIDEGINEALSAIGEFAGVDNCYGMSIDHERGTYSATHQWHTDRVRLQAEKFVDAPLDQYRWYFEQLEKHDVLRVHKLDDIPPEGENTRIGYEMVGLRSGLAVSIRHQGRLEGSIGFASLDERDEWHEDLVVLLRLVGEVFFNAQRRRDANQTLSANEARFRALVEHSSDVVGLLDKSGRLRFVSPTVERMLGYAPEELVGRVVFELVHPDDLPSVYKVFERGVAQPGVTLMAEYRVRRKDGSYIVMESAGTNRLDDPNVRGFVLNARNITERRRADTALHEAEKMRTVGQLAAGVAHNINNALTAILGYVQILRRQARDHSNESDSLRVIESTAKGAAATVRRLQSFARSATDQSEFVPIDLKELLEDAVEMTRPSWDRQDAERKIFFEVHRSEETLPVLANPAEIREVLVNLILNAVEAMPEGGKLTIESKVTLEQAHISVKDSGDGISEDVAQRLFEPFFTTKGEQGTGLGLSVSYGIVRRHAGEILVDTSPEGTVFSLWLPLHQPEDAE